MNRKILISLTHASHEIAEVIREVLHTLLPSQLQVTFSTRKAIDSSIKPEEDWIDWIVDCVRTCDFVLVPMTSTSVAEPWLLWELGAVYGAASASNPDAERKIRPLLFRIRDDDIPSPLRQTKIPFKRGDNRMDVIALFTDIIEGYREDILPQFYRSAIALLENEKSKPAESVSQEAEKSLQQLKDSRAIIGAYFRMVDAALNATLPVVSSQDWHKGLFQNTSYPITGEIIVKGRTGEVRDAQIQEASSDAEIFYGLPPNTHGLVGKKLSDQFEILRNWMEPEDFEAFVADQKSNGWRYANGMLSAARVPIVFNDNHPNSAFHGKRFLPLMLHSSQGADRTFMTKVYLDLELPANHLVRQRARSVTLPRKPSDAKGVEVADAARVSKDIKTASDSQTRSQQATMTGMGSVFISYRRHDSPDITGRIYDRLVARIGNRAVYKDVDSIPLGVDFRKHIQDSVAQCNVLLAVIGKNWLEARKKDDEGRSLDDPRDFLRIEIETALQRDIRVIPLLVQGASLPREEDLPPSLQPLAYRNAVAIRPDPDFRTDMDRLIKQLQSHLGMKKTRQ